MWALSLPIPFQPPLHAGAGGYFAPHIRVYMARSKAPDHIGILVALKDRQNALKNPYAHLHEHDITLRLHQGLDDAVGPDPLRRDLPVELRRRLRDGARQRGGGRRRADKPVAWVQGTAMRSEPTMSAGRDQVIPRGGADCARPTSIAQAGITDPRREVDCVEMYVPFSWFEPMWLENLGFAEPGEGWKLVEDGVTQLDGDLPVNCRAACCRSNPIGASGMLRFAEAAMQVRGQAGEHQIDGARTALGHAYGGGSQFFAMWVVGAEKP